MFYLAIDFFLCFLFVNCAIHRCPAACFIYFMFCIHFSLFCYVDSGGSVAIQASNLQPNSPPPAR